MVRAENSFDELYKNGDERKMVAYFFRVKWVSSQKGGVFVRLH